MPIPFMAIAAGASAVGSILSGNAQAKASKRAAELAAQAQAAALGHQRNANAQTQAYFTPYVQEGDAARLRYNALLGLPTQQTQAPTEDYAAYRARWEPTTRNNPTSPFHRMVAGLNPSDPDYDKKWSQAYEAFSGQPVGFVDAEPGAPQSPEDIAAARAQAYSDFDQSPYANAAELGAARAQNAIMGSAGANSRVLSGRTANLVQQNQTEYRANALLSYMQQLSGVAGTGYNAAGEISSAGQQFANNAGNILMDGAATQGGYIQDGAAARGEGLNNAATLAAFFAGQMGGTKKPTDSTVTGSYYAPTAAGASWSPPQSNMLTRMPR